MKTLLKIVIGVVALAVVLVVLAAVLIPLLVDPNDLKGQMAEAVREHTGRSLSIEGDIGLSVFPWVRVEIGQVSLGNAEGFEEPVFAGAERVDVGIKLMPLLSRRIEMDTVVLHGLRVNLARDQQGRGNWEDLVREKEEAPSEAGPEKGEPGEAPAIAGLAVGGLDIRDAQISWRDAQAGQQYKVESFSLQTGSIAAARPVDLSVDFRVAGGPPQVEAEVSLQGELVPDVQASVYRMNGVKLSARVGGEAVPAQELDLTMRTDIEVDLQRQTLSLPDVRLAVLGVEAEAAVAAEQILGEPRYNASLDLPGFSPRKLMQRLGMEPPQTADPEVLSKARLSTRLQGTTSSVTLEPVTIALDDTLLEGRIGVPAFEGPALRFNLAVDGIDADRYLPPPAPEGAAPAKPAPASPGTASAGAAAELPMEALRALDVEGELRIGSLKVSNLRMSDIVVKLTGKDGLIRLHPVTASMYEGSYSGDLRLNAQGRQPRLSTDEKLSGVQAGPLVRDLTGKEHITGTAQLSAELGMQGVAPEQIKRTLNGKAAFAFTDGAVKGVNVGRLLREANARLKGKSLPPQQSELQTDFSTLSGSMNISDGVVRNEDLQAKSPLLRIEGRGSVDLVREALDYRLKAVVVASAAGQGGKGLEDLKGVPIPVKITGTFAEPKFGVDLEEALKGKAKEKVKEEVKKKVEEKLQGKMGDKAEGLLRGLFQ